MVALKYRESFLTQIRLRTKRKGWAEKSVMQFGMDTVTGEYTLSLLGMINGWLPKLLFGAVLICDIEEGTLRIRRWRLGKKWWE